MTAQISWSVNGGPLQTESRDLGLLPVMVKVSRMISRDDCDKRGVLIFFDELSRVGVI